jgi:large subunit ribosomal protein L23
MHTLRPRLSEKAYGLSQATNTYVIDVPSAINKYEVADAVTKQFDVTVTSVRLVNRKGKIKRVINTTGKRGSNRKGVQADTKKAYVTLAAGSHLPFFEAEEKEAAEASKEAAKKKTSQPAEEKPKAKGLKKLVGKKETK